MVAIRALTIISTPSSKMCDDSSETFLSPWYTHKGFFRTHVVTWVVESCPLQSQELAARGLLPWGLSCA